MATLWDAISNTPPASGDDEAAAAVVEEEKEEEKKKQRRGEKEGKKTKKKQKKIEPRQMHMTSRRSSAWPRPAPPPQFDKQGNCTQESS
jgi:hypothetical protein